MMVPAEMMIMTMMMMVVVAVMVVVVVVVMMMVMVVMLLLLLLLLLLMMIKTSTKMMMIIIITIIIIIITIVLFLYLDQGAGGGAVVGFAISVWFSLGALLYGTPSPSLPPGPVDRCDADLSVPLPFNQSASLYHLAWVGWNSTAAPDGWTSATAVVRSSTVETLAEQWVPVFTVCVF